MAGIVGNPGVASNQLYNPYILAIVSSNTLYISDGLNNRIMKWVIGASSGSTVCGNANGTAGSSASTLNEPVGIVLDSSNNIYLADFLNYRAQSWAYGATSGTTIAGVTGNKSRTFVQSLNLKICPTEQLGRDHALENDFLKVLVATLAG